MILDSDSEGQDGPLGEPINSGSGVPSSPKGSVRNPNGSTCSAEPSASEDPVSRAGPAGATGAFRALDAVQPSPACSVPAPAFTSTLVTWTAPCHDGKSSFRGVGPPQPTAGAERVEKRRKGRAVQRSLGGWILEVRFQIETLKQNVLAMRAPKKGK